jgi:hypothetical protein
LSIPSIPFDKIQLVFKKLTRFKSRLLLQLSYKMNNLQSSQVRETHAREYATKQKWSQKHGQKHQTTVQVNEDAIKDYIYGNRRSVRENQDSSDSSDEEDLGYTRKHPNSHVSLSHKLHHENAKQYLDASNPHLFTGTSARFVGYYVPEEGAFETTNTLSYQKTAKLSATQMKDPTINREAFRKTDWLKQYFEEESKAKNIAKAQLTKGGEAK